MTIDTKRDEDPVSIRIGTGGPALSLDGMRGLFVADAVVGAKSILEQEGVP